MIGQKNDAFDFSPKTFTSRRIMNMENGTNFCIKKKSDSSFVISDASDFFSFFIFVFSMQIYNSAQLTFSIIKLSTF